MIDEPERHLHPALQRQAADWMRVMAAESAVQFLYASHAPAMLGVPGDVSLVHVRRTAGRTIELRARGPRTLGVLDAEIKELGMDRGELLAMYRAVLFVEGETDKVVLEELYPERLREIGLLVQPFRGAKDVVKIVEAELLLRVMGPPFHVLVDNCDAQELAYLESLDLPSLVAANKAKRFAGELAFVAALRRSALEAGCDVRVLAIQSRDILGALDTECIRDVVRELKPDARKWPSFDTVLAWGGNYNDQLAKFGLGQQVEPFRRIARAMRERQRTSDELDRVLHAIWRTTNQL